MSISVSSAFQRSPSKVWWADGLNESLVQGRSTAARTSGEWRSRHTSGSPSSHKSQDSGFSDSELSPAGCERITNTAQVNDHENQETPNRIFTADILPTDILKDSSYVEESTPKKNYKENIKEKYSPKKSITNSLTEESIKKGRLYEKRIHCRSAPSTPRNTRKNFALSYKPCSATPSPTPSPTQSPNLERLILYSPRLNEENSTPKSSYKNEPRLEPRQLLRKNSPNVNRNLLNCYPQETLSTTQEKDSEKEEVYSKSLPYLSDNLRPEFNATVPLFYEYHFKENHLEEGVALSSSDNENNDNTIDNSNDGVSTDSFSYRNDDFSDCEKEVESFFLDKLEPPPHSSTPKVVLKKFTAVPFAGLHTQETIQIIKWVNPKTEEQLPTVRCWLNELEQLYEPECMTTLQCKSISMDLVCRVNNLAEEVIAPVSDMLRHSRIISKEFCQVHKHISNQNTDHLGPLTQSLVGNITEFVLKFITHFQKHELSNSDQKRLGIHKLLEMVKELRIASNSTNPDLEEIQTLVTNLQESYRTAEYSLLGLEVQLLVNHIEDPKSNLMIRAVLSGLTILSLQCERISNLVVRTGGPRVLLILCVECKASTIRTMALRALATVCCFTVAIRQLEQADGIDVLADILSDYNRPEPELSEAVAVLAQITAPWIEDNHKVQGLAENIQSLIKTITHFLEKTQCCQNLLLCAAALANLTYMNLDTNGPIIQNNTIGKLLKAVRNRGPKASVFLKEQTATLIANLSDDSESQIYLSQNNAAVALLCFLQDAPVCPDDEPQCSSAQRLQQKSAIALSRLCSDVEVAKQIVELGGVSRLTQLCKDGRERNYSDAVLVACLATLRKIVANCGNDIMDERDVIELVEPRLLDSFLAYSSQNESYV